MQILFAFGTKLQAKYWDEFDENYDFIFNFLKFCLTETFSIIKETMFKSYF